VSKITKSSSLKKCILHFFIYFVLNAIDIWSDGVLFFQIEKNPEFYHNIKEELLIEQ